MAGCRTCGRSRLAFVFSLREEDLLVGRCGVLPYLSGVVSSWTSMDRDVVDVGLLRFLSIVVYPRAAVST